MKEKYLKIKIILRKVEGLARMRWQMRTNVNLANAFFFF